MINLSKVQMWWAKLRYWQKGAILGMGFHIFGIVLFMMLVLTGYWFNPTYGEEFNITKRHISGLLGSFALIFLSLIGAIPIYILRLFGSTFIPPVDADPATHIDAWVFYILYATAVYCLLGASIGKAVEVLKRIINMRGAGGKGK
jgi:hypothetical protein